MILEVIYVMYDVFRLFTLQHWATYVCARDTDRSLLLLSMFCSVLSFFLFHFFTKLCSLFSSLETSVIMKLKLWHILQN